jgi:hypothetical protein
MENPVDVFHRLVDGFSIRDAALKHVNPAADLLQVRGLSSAKVIQNSNPMSPLNEAVHYVRTNETGAARHQTVSHESFSLRIILRSERPERHQERRSFTGAWLLCRKQQFALPRLLAFYRLSYHYESPLCSAPPR